MNEMMNQFKNWLLKQELAEKTKSGNLSTVATYINAINRICKKCFPREFNKNNPDNAWQLLCEKIIPIAAKYYELSHKEYMLDRIDIWYAIDYFSKIFNFIYSNLYWEEDSEVNLYVFHDGQNYLIKSISLKDLYNYTQYFAALCFDHNFKLKQINPSQYDELKEIINKIVWNKKIANIREIGFHIVYKKVRNHNTRSALNHFYNCFVNPTLKRPLSQNKMMMAISQERPDKQKFYSKTQEITGIQPLQVVANRNLVNNSLNMECVLRQADLVEIFDIDRKTMQKYLDTGICYAAPDDTEKTDARKYYSVNKTNQYLSQYFHKIKGKPNPAVCYTEKGYKFWKRRSYIIKNILCQGKDAFDTLRGKKVVLDKNGKRKFIDTPYIDYFNKDNTRYYIPVFEDYAAKHPKK